MFNQNQFPYSNIVLIVERLWYRTSPCGYDTFNTYFWLH